MDKVIIDLEWNGSYSRKKKGYINEIIEFGAVKFDGELRQKSTFACFVKPQVGKKLSATISNLTSITDENLDDGATFMQAVSRFKKWAGDAVMMTWGTSDVLALIENCRYFSGEETVPFFSQYCDLQEYVQKKLRHGTKSQLGLLAAAEKLGIDVSESGHHRALSDSMVTLEILKRVYDEKELDEHIKLCDEEFYRRMTFKTQYICDPESPLISEDDLGFSCPKCGKPAERNAQWALKNRGLRSEFICPDCGYRFAGRAIIKQKYEGIEVNKKTFPLPVIEKPRDAQPGRLGNMQLEIIDGTGILKFPQLKELEIIRHGFSTRLGGVSKNEFAAMNLGFSRGDEDENVQENYRRFAAALDVAPESFVTGAQDHHTNILRVGESERGFGVYRKNPMKSVDGLCTDEPGVTLVIYCADCVPIYFVDRKNRAIGLAHAGWRGTAAGMARAMVEKLSEEFTSRPEDLTVAIGPSICRECFEVDEPVAAEFTKLDGSEGFVQKKTGEEGKYLVDLWECNRRILTDAGVPRENIFLGGVCSMCESDLIFSHRKTMGRRGSNAAALALI